MNIEERKLFHNGWDTHILDGDHAVCGVRLSRMYEGSVTVETPKIRELIRGTECQKCFYPTSAVSSS